MKSIGDDAFMQCTALKSVTILDGVTNIGSSAFAVCVALKSVTIPDGVTSIGSDAFSECDALASVTIPDGVKLIKSGTFSGCNSLESVNIPDSVTIIDLYAFSSCTSLKSVNIPDSVTSIESQAFAHCTALESITIPNSVTRIETGAFKDCDNIKLITLLPDFDMNIIKDKINIGANCVFRYICKAPTEPETTSLTYNGTEQTYALAAPTGCGYTVTGNKQTSAGSYTATATLKTGNYEEYVWGDTSTMTVDASGAKDPKTYAWSITPKAVTDPTVKLSYTETTADGTAKRPTVTVMDGTTVIPEAQYNVEYKNNTSCGTATVTVKSKTGANYTIAEKSVQFTIKHVLSHTNKLERTCTTAGHNE